MDKKNERKPVEAEKSLRLRLAELTIEILTDELGFTRVSLDMTADEMGIDSVAVVALAEELEERLNVRVDLRDLLSGIGTLDDLVDQIFRKINSSGAASVTEAP